MTFRNCVILESHLDTILHIARDEPVFREFIPALEALAAQTQAIKSGLQKAQAENVIRANFCLKRSPLQPIKP